MNFLLKKLSEAYKNPFSIILEAIAENRLSMLTGKIADMRIPEYAREPLFRKIAQILGINLDEVEVNLRYFGTINEFFTRKLNKNARKIEQMDAIIVSPCDGAIVEFGFLHKGKMLQIKGVECSIYDLLFDPFEARKLSNGAYIVIRLRPKDYHRVHYPSDCEVIGYRYIPGRLMTVHPFALKRVRNVFVKNERITTYLKCKAGRIAVVMVGATNVGRIKVSLDQITTNSGMKHASSIRLPRPASVHRGEELGYFNLGSTVVLLFEGNNVVFNENLKTGMDIFMGQEIMRLGALNLLLS
jgi:phosphatidylserine decarboxylase